MKKRGQMALESLITRGWSIFLIILILGVFFFLFSINQNYASSILNFVNQQRGSISGNAILSSELVEISSQVAQNSNLQVSINPKSQGIYKFAYVYDSEDNLKQVFSFDCEDICKEKKETQVFINDSYFGDYYVAVFDYDSDSYVKKEFKVVFEGEIIEDCFLKRAYWEREEASNSENVNLILESENCEGKEAVFSIYRNDWIFDNFIENISTLINSEKTIVSWNAKFSNLLFGNPEYYFKVKVNPEIESENNLIVLQGEVSKQPAIGFKDEGWYSWAKDSSNSRIADDSVVPPFSVKWSALYPGSETNHYLHLTRLLYQDGRLFVVMARHQSSNKGNGVTAYNATTGSLLWNRQAGGVKGNIGLFVLSNGYVWGGLDHNGQLSASVETGESVGGGARDSYANADESGVYSNGIPCTDCSTIKLEPLVPIFKPRYKVVNDSMFGNAVRFPPYPGYNFQSRDYLNVGNNLNPGSDDLTIMLWFKWDGSDGDNTLFVKGETSDYYSTIYRAGILGGKVYYTLKSDEPYSQGKKYGSGSFNCSKNEWCHFALTYDHEYQRMYKNGELVFEQNRTGDIGSNEKNIYIGGFKETNSFGGVIDEFAMFNLALSEEEIQEKMNSEITPDSSTQVLLHFNNDSAYGENDEFFYDYSENENNAFYNGHVNFYAPWSYSISSTYTGVPSSWYGGDGGLGQLALHDGIIYLPDGILSARNTSTGEVIWKNGSWPIVRFSPSSNPLELLRVGDVSHFSEVTYSDEKVYVFGKVCNAITNQITTTLSGFTIITVNETTCTNWSVPCLYSYDALTGERLGEICFDMSSYLNPANMYSKGRTFQTIIENNIAYISTIEQIVAINTLSKQKIWEYNRPVKLDSRGNYDIEDDPTDIGDIALSGDYIFGLEHFSDSLFVFDKNTGEIVWTFKSDDWDRLTGLAIVDNMVFVSGEHGKIYALEQKYTQLEIVNQETELPAGLQNTEYISYNYNMGITYKAVFKVKEGQWPFNWELVSGKLPSGLSLINDDESYNSMLIGTPTESGDFTFTIRVSDAQENSDEKEFNLKILPDSKEFTITLQDNENYSGCEDSYIYAHSAYVNTNFGNKSVLSLYQPSVNQRALIRFRIFQSEGGPVPDDAIITSAQLTLTKTTAATRKGKVYTLLREWDENLVTWNSTRFNESWEMPGASETDVDRSDLFVNFSMIGTRKVGWAGVIVNNYVDTFDVKNLFNGITPENNNGFLFEIDSSYVDVYSSDYFNTSEVNNGILKRPKLELKYKRFNSENKVPVVKVYANPTIVPGFVWPSVPNVFLNAVVYDSDGNITEYGKWPTSLLGFTGCGLGFNLSTPWLCNGGVFLGIAYVCKNYCDPNDAQYNEVTCNTGVCGTPNKTLEIEFYAYDDIGTKGTGSADILVIRSLDGKFPYFLMTTTMLRDGRVNQAYSDYVYVGGNTSKATWSLVSGNLPSGLSLNSNTGQIIGVPTTEGIYNFQVSVSAQDIVTQDLKIEVLSESGIPQPEETCSDGTVYNSCSLTKPKFCSNGTLIDDCSVCGCASGNCLENGSCGEIEPQLINSCQNLSREGQEYILAGDIEYLNGNCFTVLANDVTLDLNGHTIAGSLAYSGVYVNEYNGTTVKNGEIRGFAFGVYLENSQNSEIINITRTKQSYGIYLKSSSNNKIVGNNFDSNLAYGINVEYGSNNTIRDNKASSCKNMDCAGIHIISSANNLLINNTANGCTGPNNCAGIHLASSSGNILIDNIVKENYYHGVHIRSGSGNSLINNKVYLNDIGVHIEYSLNNLIQGNFIVDNDMGLIDVLGENNYYSDNYFDNKDYAMLIPTRDLSLVKNRSISFNISVVYPNEIPCSGVEVNNITLSPYESISYELDGNKVITRFIPLREGMYSMFVNLTDDLGNTIINRFYFGEQSSVGYYFRGGEYSHDIGYLSFEPPVNEEIIWCAQWIQFNPDEIPGVNGISRITDVNASFWYQGNTVYFGSERSGGTRLDQRKYLPSSFNYIKSSVNLYPSMWIYEPLEWKNLFLKIYGGSPVLLTNNSDKAFVNISYVYLAKPLIKEISNENIELLSATMNSVSSADIVLSGEGIVDIVISMPNSNISYNVSYDNVSCLISEKCTLNSQSNGEITLTLISSSEHLLEVYSSVEESFCGDNIINGDEVCDGNSLDEETCESQGFDSGTLSCSEDCSGFDTSECSLECELTNAYWSKNSSVEGDQMTLIVEGVNCDGQETSFQVWENDFIGDDLANFQPANSIFVSGKAETIWAVEYDADPFFDPDPEYYFIASTEGKTRTSELMSVSPATSPCVDADEDGYNVTARGICGSLVDCDDTNANVHPGAFELCNGVDDNCVNGADETNGECSGKTAICSGGRCVECVNDAQCSNNLYCDGQEVCNVNGICGSGISPTEDDGILCTLESCNETKEGFNHIPDDSVCDNGLYCDGTGYCNVALKKCEQINPQICDDGILCTLDLCSEGANLFDNLGSCVVDTSNCACTKNLDCDDNNVCTDNSCTGQLTCQKTFNINSCDDNLFCTENDVCALGNCAGTLKDVSDGVSCTIDSCNEVGKNISHVEDSSFCDNGLYCDGTERCDVLADCQPGIPPPKDDGVSCTIDFCNEAGKNISHVADNSVCDDGKYCTIDLCVGILSYDGCSHPARDCDDGNSTTFDLCNETAKNCSHSIIVNEGDDEDGDGVPDEFDKCPGTPLNIISAVDKFGCPLPVYTKFDIITNLTNIDLGNISNFEIGIRNYGEIRYSRKNISLIPPPTGGGGGGFGGGGSYNGSNYSRIDFDSTINISQYKIELDSSNLPQMNKSAEIIFFNISFISPKILRNRENCTDCQIILWNKNLSRLEFSVPHFTSYEVVEGYNSCGNLSCDAGETCSNCPSDCGNCPSGNNNGGSGGSSGSGGTFISSTPGCAENWTCSSWSDCSSGLKTRTCEDKNVCGTENIKPAISETCEQDIIGEEKPKTTNALTNITSRINLKLVLIILAIVIVAALVLVILILRRIKNRRIQELRKEIRKKK